MGEVVGRGVDPSHGGEVAKRRAEAMARGRRNRVMGLRRGEAGHHPLRGYPAVGTDAVKIDPM